MAQIDLNCDMGESFGVYSIGMDDAVIRYITSSNIACGFHAGDPMVISRTVKMAADHGAAIGAHPGFPDLMGFGRRNMDCTIEEVRNYVIYQVGAIRAFCKIHGLRLQHVKPHGSLYNMSVGNEEMSRAIAEAVAAVDSDLILMTLAGKHAELMAGIAREAGIRIALEAFPDRAYTPEGALASRNTPGAVITDPGAAAERAVRMALEGRVIAMDGNSIPMEVHTLCVHGDTQNAVEMARAIRMALDAEGIEIVPVGKMLLRQPA